MFDRPDKYHDRECLIFLIMFYPYIKLLSYELVKSNAWNDKTMSIIQGPDHSFWKIKKKKKFTNSIVKLLSTDPLPIHTLTKAFYMIDDD